MSTPDILRRRSSFGAMLVVLPVLLAGSACGAPPPTGRVEIPPPPTAEPISAPDPEIASVAAAREPAQLIVDGDLAEWGSLLPPVSPPGKTGKAVEQPRKGPPAPDPNPAGAASHVAVAITADGARIAADLGEMAREGFWLGIGSAPSDLPPVGDYTQVGGSVNEPEMGISVPECEAPSGSTAPYNPDTDPGCLAFRRERAAEEAAHARRFQRLFRIDREGVRVATADGELATVAGATAVFKTGAKGATAEASVPLLALPRLCVAPLGQIRLVGRAATTPRAPDLTAADWVELELPSPVAFEPLAQLRAKAFDVSEWMSYQPGDPLHVEVMRYPSHTDRRSFVTSEQPLYVKQATSGDVEIGYLTIARPSDTYSGSVLLAVLAKGAHSVIPIRGVPVFIAARDGDLHVLSYDQEEGPFWMVGSDSSFGEATTLIWSAIVVRPEGSHDRLSFDDDPVIPWERVEELHDKDSFGMRGYAAAWARAEEKEGRLVELRWRWDDKQKKYVVKRQNDPPAGKKAKTGSAKTGSAKTN